MFKAEHKKLIILLPSHILLSEVLEMYWGDPCIAVCSMQPLAGYCWNAVLALTSTVGQSTHVKDPICVKLISSSIVHRS